MYSDFIKSLEGASFNGQVSEAPEGGLKGVLLIILHISASDLLQYFGLSGLVLDVQMEQISVCVFMFLCLVLYNAGVCHWGLCWGYPGI